MQFSAIDFFVHEAPFCFETLQVGEQQIMNSLSVLCGDQGRLLVKLLHRIYELAIRDGPGLIQFQVLFC